MRSTALVGVVLVLLASRTFAAEPVAYKATVTDAEVIVRAGPSNTFADTGTLKRDSVVIVEREENNGWLAIKAPEGSVSWIAFAFIEDITPGKPTPKHGIVHSPEGGDVTLACGKVGLAQPLDVRLEKLPEGTQVTLVGAPVVFNGKKWWPIIPPAGDVRYLPRTAVQFGTAINDKATVRVTESSTSSSGALPPPSPAVAPLASIPTASPTTPASGTSTPVVNHPLWTQAETAERDGRLDDAKNAYFELAGIMNKDGDRTIANLCFTRIHMIREKQRGTVTKPTTTRPSTNVNSVQPQPAREERGARAGRPVPLPPAANTSTNTDNTSGAQSYTGILVWSNVTPDGTNKPAYALLPSKGAPPIVYVYAGQGMNLDKFRNQRVRVQGTPQTGSASKPYVVATNVELAE